MTSEWAYATIQIASNQAPVANAGGPYTVPAGQSLTLIGTNSYDPNGDAIQFRWDFGDGISTSPVATHTWASVGTSTVWLTVSDTLLSNTTSTTVFVLVPNHAPVLSLPANQTVHAQMPISLLATATDTDTPPQTLTFSLVSGPTGLAVAPAGTITWTPGKGQVGTNYSVTVGVTDSGIPVMGDTNSFNILVAPPLALLSIGIGGGQANLTWSSISGRTYQVKSGPTVMSATGIVTTVTATNVTARCADSLGGARTSRFYRVATP